MSVMNMIEALNSAHDVMMERDPDMVVFGEDVGFFGGVFRVTAGLHVNGWDDADAVKELVLARPSVDTRRLADPQVDWAATRN